MEDPKLAQLAASMADSIESRRLLTEYYPKNPKIEPREKINGVLRSMEDQIDLLRFQLVELKASKLTDVCGMTYDQLQQTLDEVCALRAQLLMDIESQDGQLAREGSLFEPKPKELDVRNVDFDFNRNARQNVYHSVQREVRLADQYTEWLITIAGNNYSRTKIGTQLTGPVFTPYIDIGRLVKIRGQLLIVCYYSQITYGFCFPAVPFGSAELSTNGCLSVYVLLKDKVFSQQAISKPYFIEVYASPLYNSSPVCSFTWSKGKQFTLFMGKEKHTTMSLLPS